MLSRRRFIQLSGLSAGSVVLTSQLSGCQKIEPEIIGWSPPNPNQDQLLKVLSYALLAPNAHNTQPWHVHILNDHEFELYVDPDRLLPKTDPIHRQIHISQGTFLETAKIAASHFQLQADINYFPEGEYSNQVLIRLPVARVRLKPSEQPEDPLFAALLERRSNKNAYESSALTLQQQQVLHDNMKTSHATLFLESSSEKRDILQQFLVDAMAVESECRERDLETIAMFRFNDDEVLKYRDGFGVAQSGTQGVKKWLAESFFLSRKKAEENPKEFGRQSVQAVKEVAKTTQTFAWLETETNTRLDQVKAGQDYCRLNITTTMMGLAQHPMSQVLQEYSDMLPLQQKFKDYLGVAESSTVQMFCRLGYAPTCPHTPRRPVNNILV